MFAVEDLLQKLATTNHRRHSFTSKEAARSSLLYSYKHSLNGFAAILSEDEATELSGPCADAASVMVCIFAFS